jgi:hypothetical protein
MNRRSLWLLGCFVILGVGAAVLWATMPRERVTLENYERVKSCTTRAEVEEILGPPHYEPGRSPFIVLWDGGLRTMALRNIGPSAHVWASQDLAIYVTFKDGRVDSATHSPPWPLPPRTFWGKLRDWLRSLL